LGALDDSEDRSRKLASGVASGADVSFGALLDDGKRNALEVDLHRGFRLGGAEGDVRAPLIVEPDAGLAVGVGVNLGTVALKAGFVVFDRAPEPVDKT
jgi:hypothetical protein